MGFVPAVLRAAKKRSTFFVSEDPRFAEPKAVLPAAHHDPKWYDAYRQPPAAA
jgi:hypothetical protein